MIGSISIESTFFARGFLTYIKDNVLRICCHRHGTNNTWKVLLFQSWWAVWVYCVVLTDNKRYLEHELFLLETISISYYDLWEETLHWHCITKEQRRVCVYIHTHTIQKNTSDGKRYIYITWYFSNAGVLILFLCGHFKTVGFKRINF